MKTNRQQPDERSHPRMMGPRIVADVGGTNVRFAITSAQPDGLIDLRCYRTGDFPCFLAALERFVDETGSQRYFSGIAVGAAGPVDDGIAYLTNGTWRISEAEVSAALNGCPARVVNDVEAVAFALPLLQSDDRFPIGLIKVPSAKPRTLLVINVGTGFGAAALVPSSAGWVSVPSEAGHMDLRTHDKRNGLVVDTSVESVLSGTGVATLMARFGPNDESHSKDTIENPAAFGAGGSERAIGQPDQNLEARDFNDLLGEVAGNLALAMGAWGGVFFCGGVIDAWKRNIDQKRFRTRFESKGSMTARMQQVFTGVITKPNVALLGLAQLSM
jgi:glucokinase